MVGRPWSWLVEGLDAEMGWQDTHHADPEEFYVKQDRIGAFTQWLLAQVAVS